MKLKTDTIEFDTQKDINQIANALRSFGGDIEKIDDDPIAVGPRADIAVVLSGRVGFIGGFKHFRPGASHNSWGVQVFVHDLGNRRHIELIALGETSFNSKTPYGLLNLGASKEKRDALAQTLA